MRASKGTSDIFQVATFEIHRQIFAVDIMRVREIIRPVKTTPVHGASSNVVGVFNLRGTVIPLFTMSDGSVIESFRRAKFMILSFEGRNIALLVDSVLNVRSVPRENIGLAENVFGKDAQNIGVLGVAQLENDVIFLLDIRTLVEGLDIDAFERLTLQSQGGDLD